MVGGINRRNSYLKAVRKRKIDETAFHWWYSEERGYGMYNNLHQYSKNKIHCSCPMCSAKTRIDGCTISDRRKIDKLAYVE